MRIFNSLTVASVVAAAAALIPQTAGAERVCRQDCVGPVCQERCVDATDGRGDRRDGRDYRRGDRREWRDDRRDRGPGIELRVPGLEIR
jgi:hypothetical protein